MKKIFTLRSIIALLYVSFASISCKSVYEPNLVNIPLMQQKNELIATVDQKNLQVAYAVTDHVALMANGFYTSQNPGDREGEQGGYGYLAEAGIGYYMPIEGNMVFETYGGFGFGNATLKNNVENSSGNMVRQTFSANGYKFFIQPDIGYKSRFFDAGFASRLSVIDYNDPSTTNYPQADQERDRLHRVGDATYVFLEPGIVIRGGYRFIKLQLQYCRSLKVNDAPLNYDKDNFSIGLFVNLNNTFGD